MEDAERRSPSFSWGAWGRVDEQKAHAKVDPQHRAHAEPTQSKYDEEQQFKKKTKSEVAGAHGVIIAPGAYSSH